MTTVKINRDFLAALTRRIQDLYLADHIPWVVGYSGGKDSTATLQLVWRAVGELPVHQRSHKSIHVISTDTLVEQPIVAAWVNKSLGLINAAASEQGLPIEAHRLTPDTKDTFWVNLIGKGYPTPRRTFRWCTSRLKIEPSNRFIQDVVARHGEAILVLGTRKAESMQRAANMERYEERRIRDWLSPNGNLPNSLIFTPIEDWQNDDVWLYLMQVPNPWGVTNKDLLAMYRGASEDNECPLVVDTTTPSCGSSRFGCWTCTVVSQDKSMEAMIQNDWEKAWMTPLLELRNELGRLNANGMLDDWDWRDFRRMSGRVELDNKGRAIHGPYTRERRHHWLRRLLEVEQEIQRNGPEEMGDLRLISDDELREIRRIWLEEKHEFEDAVPQIYEEVKGEPYPFMSDFRKQPFGPLEWNLLQDFCDDQEIFMELLTSMLNIQQRNRGLVRRGSITEQLEGLIRRAYYSTEEEAVAVLRKRNEARAKYLHPHDPIGDGSLFDDQDEESAF